MNLTIEQNKKLVEEFPFLKPCNIWTGKAIDNYNYEYINGIGDLPKGWERLFLLFCKYLKKELVSYNYLEEFKFSQIKEKYGSMRLYNNGYPKESKISELEYIFEHLSTYVCEDCGNIAKYTTPGWITQLCQKCFFDSYSIKMDEKDKFKKHRKNFVVTIKGWENNTSYVKKYNSKPYWEEYLKCRKMSKEEFLNYILEENKYGEEINR